MCCAVDAQNEYVPETVVGFDKADVATSVAAAWCAGYPKSWPTGGAVFAFMCAKLDD